MNLICKNCNKQFEYHRRKQHCSNECFSEWRRRPDVLTETVRRRSVSNILKYGVANVAHLDEFKDKAKKTCQEKYGSNSPTQNAIIRQKQVDTCILRHGADNPQKNLDIRKKQQSTLFKNYGVAVPTKSERVMKKIKATVLRVYGTDNPAKNLDVKNKMRVTNFAKYGTEYTMQNPEIRKKANAGISNFFYGQICNRLKLANILPLFLASEYTNQRDYHEYPFRCQTCNTEFSDHLMHGHIPECPTCSPKKSISISEDEILEFIKSIDSTLKVERHNRKILSGLELDIYIPSKKLAIEFNGNYWHSEVSGKKNKRYHIHKTESCEKLGIQLIHIFEDEWIYKNDIVKNELRCLFADANSDMIDGSKCTVREIESGTSNKFLDMYHFRGADKSSIRLGTYYNSELVAVMTFGKTRLIKSGKAISGEYEIYRFGSKNTVSDIIPIFIEHFIKLYSPTKIIAHVDRRFSNINTCSYSTGGFSFVANTAPGCWYIHPKNSLIREHRVKYRKSVLATAVEVFDQTKTEWENMKINGYDRIWDCGHLKYEMVVNNQSK